MHQLALFVGTQSLRCERTMETPTNTPNKQKAGEAPTATTQDLQVVPSASLTSLSGAATTATPRSTDPTIDTFRITVFSDAHLWSCPRIS
ncbi:UNVERIFIED_CONTAM: hypothetical protein Sradi_6193900 [Sesamum radiatum]|uniref:Uncharacterized protein n=1 Tax=Sesamum radiatum TaxID=300843 RepID=A0AAW2K9X0_SESRA